MQIHTNCPGCGKVLKIDTRHREPYAIVGQSTVVAKERCDECRHEVTISIYVAAEGATA